MAAHDPAGDAAGGTDAGPLRLRIIVAGTAATIMDCASAWQRHHDVVAVVSMPREALPDKSVDLRSLAALRAIPYCEVADINNPSSIAALRELRPDILFASWPKLMSRSVIDIARMGCIGTHPTPLPANRGRHPLHWMLVLGIEQSCVSFFLMDEGIDSGDLLLQTPFRVGVRADIKEALAAMAAAMVAGCATLAEQLALRSPLVGRKQDHRQANTWRARSVFDTLIDFRMSAQAIDRLVRSFSAPFGGAKLVCRDRLIAIGRTEFPSDQAGSHANREPGRILRRSADFLTVRADDRPIELFPREPAGFADLPDDLHYFLPPTAYFDQCWPRIQELI